MTTRDAPEPGRPKRSRRKQLAQKLMLASASLVVFPLVLETGVRLFGEPPTPWVVRDGVYHHSLPPLNGRKWAAPMRPGVGEPVFLPADKAEGELRVFVFGESSVQGAPWGVRTSAPAMLADLLRGALPGRDVTVVNMGRGSAMTLDTYYYLVAVRHLAPDIVIFYQGTNDEYPITPESCLPVSHPLAHGAWRWLAAHSRLLWTLRVWAPTWLHEDAGAGTGSTPMRRSSAASCTGADASRAWTRLLIDTATDTGAQVITTTPVLSDLAFLEYDRAKVPQPDGFVAFLDQQPAAYRDLVRCVLTTDCALPEALVRLRAARPPPPGAEPPPRAPSATAPEGPQDRQVDLTELLDRPRAVTEFQRETWRAASEEAGATRIDFDAILRAGAPDGLLLPPLVVDTVHLSIDGYWRLARLWAQATLALVGEPQMEPLEIEAAPDPIVRHYMDMVDGGPHGSTWYCDLLFMSGGCWLQSGALVLGASLLGSSWDQCRSEEAGMLLGWLRHRLGVPGHGATGDLDAQAIDTLVRESLCRRRVPTQG